MRFPEARVVSPQRYLWNNTDHHLKYRSNEVRSPRVWGVMQAYAVATNRSVTEGRFLTATDVEHSADVLVIGDEIREKLFPREDPLNKKIVLGHDAYTVVGVFDKKGKMFGDSQDNFVVMPITTFDHRFPWIRLAATDGDALRISAVPNRPEDLPLMIDKARTVLRTRRHVRFDQPDDFGIVTPDKMIESFQGITNGVTLAMVFIAFISLVIGGVGVMNIMLVSVTERTREIGVRKAVGALRRDIVLQFLTEAVDPVAHRRGDRRRRRRRRTGSRQEGLRRAAGGNAAVVRRRGPGGLDLGRHLLRPLSGRSRRRASTPSRRCGMNRFRALAGTAGAR